MANYLGRVAGTDLLEPQARWHMFEEATGTNPYPDLDRFNRVTSSRWTGYKGTGTRDFYHVDLGYDAASNIVSAVDHVHRTGLAGAGDGLFDVEYMLDELHRLKRAVEGNWTGSAINNVTRDERWQDSSGDLALSQTGNWLRRRLDLTGNGQFTGTGELDGTSTDGDARVRSSAGMVWGGEEGGCGRSRRAVMRGRAAGGSIAFECPPRSILLRCELG